MTARPAERLPSGVAQLATVIGRKAAIDLAFWRWWRRVVTTPPNARPPRAVSIYIPKRVPREDHRLTRDVGEADARKLVAAMPGETVDCYLESWLAEHALINRVVATMAREVEQSSSPNAAAQRAAARHGWKDRTAWLKIYDAPPRWSPLDDLPWYVEAELRGLLDPTIRGMAWARNRSTPAMRAQVTICKD